MSDFPSTGEEGHELRRVTLADDENAVEKPIVEDFTTNSLGAGLRVLRYSVEDENNAVMSGLRYAWRNDEHGRDVVVITGSPAPAQILSALDDIDELAQCITLRHNDYVAPDDDDD